MRHGAGADSGRENAAERVEFDRFRGDLAHQISVPDDLDVRLSVFEDQASRYVGRCRFVLVPSFSA